MSTAMTLDIRGLPEATAAVQRFGRSGQRIVLSALSKAGNKEVAELRGVTPARTGKLRMSWSFTFLGTYGGVIRNRAPYFPFVELGTGVIRPTSRRVLAFNVGGQRVFAKFARGQTGKHLLLSVNPARFAREVEKEIESQLRAAGLA